ncbi:MAG: hypothetical protein AB1758_11190 [Candidatus Eremiobacterota bacterium]
MRLVLPILLTLVVLAFPLQGAPSRLPAVFDHAAKLVADPNPANWDKELTALAELRKKVEERAPRVPYSTLPMLAPGRVSKGDRMEFLDGETLVVDGSLNLDNYVRECVIVVTGDLLVTGYVEKSYVVVGGKAEVGTHTESSLVLVRPKNPLKVGSYSKSCILGAQTLENNQYIESTILFGDLKPGSYPEKRRSEILSARALAEGFR